MKKILFTVGLLSLPLWACSGKEEEKNQQQGAPVVTFTSHASAATIQAQVGDTLSIAATIAAQASLKEVKLSTINATEVEQPLLSVTQFATDRRYELRHRLAINDAITRFSVQVSDVENRSATATLNIEVLGGKPVDTVPVTNPTDTLPMDNTPVAFPGAEGFAAATTTGGRGGEVYYVTNLNDNGAGSLREALGKSGARTIMFKVSGTIELNSRLDIKNGNLTIAGQTAPGDGICLKNYSMRVQASNVVIRYLRFRMGDDKGYEGDAFEGQGQSNVIIDHCSMSWSTDECSSFYDNTNFTMQWCILSESLRNSVHVKEEHGYGGILGGKGASFHHNLLAHHDSRNPRFCGSRYSKRADLEKCDFRNNVIYNWGSNSGYAGEGGVYNFVNNYYKSGRASSNKDRIFQPNGQDQSKTSEQPGNVWGKFWLEGNYVNGYANVTADNWQGLDPKPSSGSPLPNGTVESLKLASAFEVPNMETHTAEEAYQKVLSYAGASYRRDAVDTRVANEVRNNLPTANRASNGTTKIGLIDKPADVGGYPTLNQTAAPTDTDGDGMPDEWEAAYNLNKNDAADGKLKTLSTHYTNLEVYINSLVSEITEGQK
jgi:hypothetical protein